MDALGLPVVAVVAKLVLKVEQNKGTACETNSQTSNIDERICFLLPEISVSNPQIVSEQNTLTFLRSVYQSVAAV